MYPIEETNKDKRYIPSPGDFFCSARTSASHKVNCCIAVGKQFIFASEVSGYGDEEHLCCIMSEWREATPDDFMSSRILGCLQRLEDGELTSGGTLESIMSIITEVKGAA